MSNCSKKIYQLYKLAENELKPDCQRCYKRKSTHNLINDLKIKKICDFCVSELTSQNSGEL